MCKKSRGKRLRKHVNDYYSMDLCACGFETQATPPNSLATTAAFHLMK